MNVEEDLVLLEDALSAVVLAQHVHRLLPSLDHEDLVRATKKDLLRARGRLLAQAGPGLSPPDKSRLFRRVQHLETFCHTWLRAELVAELSHTAATAAEEAEAEARYLHRRNLFLDALRGQKRAAE